MSPMEKQLVDPPKKLFENALDKERARVTARSPIRRQTKQREAIIEAFRCADRPLRPDEAWRVASQTVARMGLATVYRAIKDCVEQGVLSAVPVPGEPDRYEVSGKHHHHHFLCTECDGLYEVDHCPGRFDALAPNGFLVERHELTLVGVCKECRMQ